MYTCIDKITYDVKIVRLDTTKLARVVECQVYPVVTISQW